jgi:hypothetical protein
MGALGGDARADAARGAERYVGVTQNFALAVAALFFVMLSMTLAKIEHLALLDGMPEAVIVRPFFVLLGLLLATMGNAKARAAFPIGVAVNRRGGFQARRVQAWVIVLAVLGLCGVIVVASIAVRLAVSDAASASTDGPAA